MHKKLSVITINYNNKAGLMATMSSVLSQTAIASLEYILVDGASDDGSRELIASYSDKVSKWVSEPDSGIYNAMNKGVTMASGDYCLFLNSGDVLHDERVIDSILPALDAQDFIVGRVLFLNTGRISSIDEPLTLNRFYNGSIPHPSTFIKRDLLLKDPYDESYRIVSDWKFFLKHLIIESATYRFVDCIVSDYNSEGISSVNKALVDKERKHVYREFIPDRILTDYIQFNNGTGYTNTPYDNFYIKLRPFSISKIVYPITVLIVRLVSLFKKKLRFAFDYPMKSM